MEQLKGLLILGRVFLDFKIWAHTKVTENPSQHNRSWGEIVGRRWHRVANKTLTGREVERWVNFPAFIRTLLECSSGHQTSDNASQNITCNVTTDLLTNAAPTQSAGIKVSTERWQHLKCSLKHNRWQAEPKAKQIPKGKHKNKYQRQMGI